MLIPPPYPLITVVVPAYNQQRYIRKCIHSILRQTYPNLEILLVNDASTDRTLSIATKMAAKDSRLRIISQPVNQGVDRARFRGIGEAKGDFLVFVDSDDWLPLNSIEVLYQAQQKDNADIVEGGNWRVFDSLALFKKLVTHEAKVIRQPELFDDYYISYFGYNKLEVSLWAKLFRKSLFDDVRPQPSGLSMGEDMLVSMQLLPAVNCYVVIDQPVYYYRWGGSTSRYKVGFYPNLKRQYFIKQDKIAQYSYDKADVFTKIEMCNVAFTECVQLLRFNKGRAAAVAFVNEEIASGFIDEVAGSYETKSPKVQLLRQHKTEAFVDLAQQEADSKAWLRKLLLRTQWLLHWI